MGGAFSSKKAPVAKPSISSIDRAVLDLKNARDRLQRYRSRLEVDQGKLLERARQAKQENKTSRALGLLKLKKFKSQQMHSCEDQLLNVLQMIDTIDSKQNEAQILASLQSGKDALQKLHQEHSIEDVLRLMDEVAEENEVEMEINHILSGVPDLSVEDEALVEAELEALMQGTGAVESETVSLPEAPRHAPAELPEVPEHAPTNKVAIQGEQVAVPS